MKLNKIFFIVLLLSLLLATYVIATAQINVRNPANLFQTTNGSINFTMKINSTNINLTGPNMTIYLFTTTADNETTFILNKTITNCINNTLLQCNTSITTFSPGYYAWYVNVEDLDGNTTSETFWFEVRSLDNDTLFRWQNASGFEAMILQKNFGNLKVPGNVTAFRFNGSLDTGTIIITGDIDDEHIEGDINTYVDIAGDVMVGNITFNQSSESYPKGNGSYITDVCLQNGSNCDNVFAWVSLNNESTFSANPQLFGATTGEATYLNSFAWNGTHLTSPVNGSYKFTIDLKTNSSLITNFALTIYDDDVSLRNVTMTHSVINSFITHSLTYVGCMQVNDNITIMLDSDSASTIQFANSSSLTIERLSSRCYN